jgi:hypothetical protein
MPINEVDIEDVPDLTPDSDNKDDKDDKSYVGEDVLKDEDCIFIATIPYKAKFIHTTSNILHKNSKSKYFTNPCPHTSMRFIHKVFVQSPT